MPFEPITDGKKYIAVRSDVLTSRSIAQVTFIRIVQVCFLTSQQADRPIDPCRKVASQEKDSVRRSLQRGHHTFAVYGDPPSLPEQRMWSFETPALRDRLMFRSTNVETGVGTEVQLRD